MTKKKKNSDQLSLVLRLLEISAQNQGISISEDLKFQHFLLDHAPPPLRGAPLVHNVD